MSTHKVTLAALSTVCVLAGGLFASAPALAGTTHPFVFAFDGFEVPQGHFVDPVGVAVDRVAHSVYVVDASGGAGEAGIVDRFDDAGALLGQNSGAEAPGGAFGSVHAIAVDNSGTASDGELYVGTGAGQIDAFGADGKLSFVISATEVPGEALGVNGLAVDEQGHIYVANGETGEIDKFSSAGAFLEEIKVPATVFPRGLAIDAVGDIYVVADERIVELSSSGQEIREMPSDEPQAVAVDTATEDAYVAGPTSITEYSATGEVVSRFGSHKLFDARGIAVDAGTEAIFVSDEQALEILSFGPAATAPDAETGVCENLSQAGATVQGLVDPASETLPASFQFEYGTTMAYEATSPATPQSVGTGLGSTRVSAVLAGLEPNTTYHYRLVASNTNGTTEGEDRTCTTLGAPSVAAESFSDVGSSSADLSAKISAAGLSSTYQFEYGTTVSYGSTTSPINFGSSHEAVAVPALVEGLQPDTLYHFRVIAHNALGTVAGVDTTFETLSVAPPELPDGRVYEMVSPARNQDADVYAPTATPGIGDGAEGYGTLKPFEASLSGDAVTYVGDPTSGGNGSSGLGGGNQYLATRSPAGGWSQTDIQPSGRLHVSYQAFSPELSTGILEPTVAGEAAESPLTPEAPGEGYDVLYSRASENGSYHPLFAAKPPNRSPQTFGTSSNSSERHYLEPLSYAGGSADMRHLLFEADDALTPEAEADAPTATEDDLYDSIEGQPRLVNVLPDGTAHPGATFGGRNLTGSFQDPSDFSHVISEGGSRIFWTALSGAGEPEALYVRENDASSAPTTTQVDAPRGGTGEGGHGQYWTASGDGSRVFFTDAAYAGLTADTVQYSGNNLYIFDVADRQLLDLTGNQESPGVEGVLGASENGEYVYFVATGVLAANENANKETAQKGNKEGLPNLYLWHNGVTSFIATLESDDDAIFYEVNGDYGDWQPSLGNRTAEVSPNGEGLVFISSRSLTGYSSQNHKSEVYVYDAGSGRLACASCTPSGEPASASGLLQLSGGGDESRAYQPRSISADGSRVFFDSGQPLVAAANSKQNVYEWERYQPGSKTDSCTNASGETAAQNLAKQEKGCVYLLSGGSSNANSYFIDASASGNDVFIVTRARLVSQDQNENYDLYDVRVGGAQPPTPAACTGTGCQGVPPAPPTFATPASVTFNGAGNFVPLPKAIVKPKSAAELRAERLAKALKLCKKDKKKSKRARCEKNARERYGAKAGKKVSNRRRSKR